MPFFNLYKPQFYFRTINVTGTIHLPSNIEMAFPRDTIDIKVELIFPIAMEVGTEFNVRDANKIVGKGTITKVY